MKIVIADDDLELLELVSFTLRQACYLTIAASDGLEALRVVEREQPDLVILDINMPGMSGFEVCRQIRAQSTTPILMLTVRSDEDAQVHGLDLGADDYLTKPFSPRTLQARVRALLRRSGLERPAQLASGDLALDMDEQTVAIGGGQPVRLTNLEFRLVQYLLANAGRTISADRLMTHVWGYQEHSDRNVLKQLVHRVRQKIEHDPAAPRYLLSVSGIGYTLLPAPARSAAGEPSLTNI